EWSNGRCKRHCCTPEQSIHRGSAVLESVHVLSGQWQEGLLEISAWAFGDLSGEASVVRPQVKAGKRQVGFCLDS
ncbi:hypothetical protein, partial [Xanthomonas graminis]|uniref:hypothetical protein n=1 Tax=Xanthomonas graminis TaxID=3390026 RepID=UPI001C8F364C